MTTMTLSPKSTKAATRLSAVVRATMTPEDFGRMDDLFTRDNAVSIFRKAGASDLEASVLVSALSLGIMVVIERTLARP